jgi:hypothetical protein
MARFTTARITAFNPGQSPPPVKTPMRMTTSHLDIQINLLLEMDLERSILGAPGGEVKGIEGTAPGAQRVPSVEE